MSSAHFLFRVAPRSRDLFLQHFWKMTDSCASFFFQVVDVPARKYLIMQFSSGGDLCRYVREKRRLGDEESCRLFCQIVRGLEYCHSCGIVHRLVSTQTRW